MYVVCRRGNVLCTLFVGGVVSYVLCTLFVGGVMSYVRCL